MGSNGPKSFDAAFRAIQAKKERQEAASKVKQAEDAVCCRQRSQNSSTHSWDE